jgi:hypothetical protein
VSLPNGVVSESILRVYRQVAGVAQYTEQHLLLSAIRVLSLYYLTARIVVHLYLLGLLYVLWVGQLLLVLQILLDRLFPERFLLKAFVLSKQMVETVR